MPLEPNTQPTPEQNMRITAMNFAVQSRVRSGDLIDLASQIDKWLTDGDANPDAS